MDSDISRSPSPSPSMHTLPFTSQVGGHAGVMASEDGSLLIKPALPVEVNFYQSVASDPHFEPLRPYMPKFFGTLRLEGSLDHEKNMEGEFPIKQDAKGLEGLEKDTSHCYGLGIDGDANERMSTHSIVLENLSHTFLKPNILDIKLGTVLYDESASEEKRARMLKTARETTSLETGIRLTGFQVYDTHRNVAVNTPKSYGKSIKASDLPDGIARFFPVASEASTRPKTANLLSVEPAPAVGTGLPKDLLLPILESVHEDITEVRAALAQVEMRMVGGSLLVIYEADANRAREGLEAWLKDGDDEEDDDEEDEEDERTKRPGPPCLVKLIDFAHTRLVPGEGPDQGVLLGVDTVLRLLDGRIKEVKQLS